MNIGPKEIFHTKKKASLKPKIVAEARSWLGTKFQHQARIKKTLNQEGGCDCLGLILGVADKLSIKSKNNIPFSLIAPANYARIPKNYDLILQLKMHLHQINVSDLDPGDLLLLEISNNPVHLAIVGNYDNDQLSIIHSYFPARSVVEHRLDQEWLLKIRGAYSFYTF